MKTSRMQRPRPTETVLVSIRQRLRIRLVVFCARYYKAPQ